MIYGYARVSTTEQNLDRQIDALVQAGVPSEAIYCDKVSGAKAKRPALDDLLSRLRSGDTVVILSFDRLARSTRHLLELSERFATDGINLISLKEQIDTSTPQGKLYFTISSAIAEFQRSLIRESQREGIDSAKSRGKSWGRKPIDNSKIETALTLRATTTMSVNDICQAVGISRACFYRYLDKANQQA